MSIASGTVAVIAAHADDEVLGCGGTVARFARSGQAVHILLVADGETARLSGAQYADANTSIEQRVSAAESARAAIGATSLECLGFPDNRLDGMTLLDLVKPIEDFVRRHTPTMVFTHHAGDVNIDHQTVHHAVIAACRPQPGHSVADLLFFEVPSSTEWRPRTSAEPFTPDTFVDISSTLSTKLDGLRAYESELQPFPHPRSLAAVEALARWRGATSGCDAAEAFVTGRRIIR